MCIPSKKALIIYNNTRGDLIFIQDYGVSVIKKSIPFRKHLNAFVADLDDFTLQSNGGKFLHVRPNAQVVSNKHLITTTQDETTIIISVSNDDWVML